MSVLHFVLCFLFCMLGFFIHALLSIDKISDLKKENWKLREDNGRLRYNAEVIRNAK